ncbi:orotidine-5'-phosphate decarboxylase [Thermocrinis minervae]|uniref:Orotidine 5'-phosphate decarboxylase n=1 Tax=Thermocrinis minervae TaxID=381751 RepID=A0A1M6TKP8_9AQUI|nr:orotidine-5'-phosphate decarboxylase [Thermocrinis minervae]SHK57348.1 orotidine-5'-phosphate decarboxylase [Thermocrinis minervae]
MAKLCLALDLPSEKAKEVLFSLKGYPLVIKVGYKLFISHHRAITDLVKELGFELFLDLKLHDIPNTVKEGVLSARDLGADYLTLHILSGKQALREAVKVKGNTKLLGVSVLTSLTEEDLEDLGFCSSLEEEVVRLVSLGMSEGIDGVVCSGLEAPKIKDLFPHAFVVVPGVRFRGDEVQDQKRVLFLEDLPKGVVDMVVMGRSLLENLRRIDRALEILHER